MKMAHAIHKEALQVILDPSTDEDVRVQRMLQYCTEEMPLVEKEMAASIALLESIQMQIYEVLQRK